ncbi:2678_t:CDS:10, partial [Dentiscutata heterogama]
IHLCQDMYVNSQHERENFILDLTPKKRALDDQYEEISKFTKYNNDDSIRTFRKSNTINTDFSENLSLNNTESYIDDPKVNSKKGARTPANLIFNRFKIFFHATCNANSGLPKHHILNIVKNSKEMSKEMSTNIVIQHIFPKQFGHCNVFDYDNNGQLSVESLFQSYQNRITEIQKSSADIPHRLTQVLPMIREMISNHKKCGYKYLLNRFCPVARDRLSTSPTDINYYIQSSSNTNQVYTFVCAVLQQVIPEIFWAMEVFILLRFYEELSLHNVLKKFKIMQCAWLIVEGNKNNKVEADKRSEILYEFIWWIFDCFVISLLQTTFYITTHTMYENRVFYYRKDVWLQLEKNAQLLDKKFSDLDNVALCFDEIYECLKYFKQSLTENRRAQSKIYFAKVEVQREMELAVFPFVKRDNDVMLRFLADFLYISADKENVERFITTMYKDHPCAVNKEKSLTNFDIIVNRKPIKKLSNTFASHVGLSNSLFNIIYIGYSLRILIKNYVDIENTLTVKDFIEAFKQAMIE